MASSGPPLLELRGITRRFPGVVANDDVSLTLERGEVLGLLGENGAGKSSLMSILAGLVSPDSGAILLSGREALLPSPLAAAAAGIGMVHQHFKLIGAMTVRDNLALGDARWGRLTVDHKALADSIGRLATELRMEVDLDAIVDDLPVGRQQQVEILKALSRDPAILILDEPTAVLTPEERDGLFAMLARLKARGTGIILISHRLEDVIEGCDRVAVMRQGRIVGGGAVAGLGRADLVRLVFGDDLAAIEHRPANAGTPVLRATGLSLRRANGTSAIDDASFDLRTGEIVALCGVDGNGQSELVQILAGMMRPDAGSLTYRLRGQEHAGPLSAAALRRLGLGHVAEDRLRHAVVPGFTLAANWLLTTLFHGALAPRGWLNLAAANARCGTAIRDYDVKASGPGALLRHLSGGNQQKLVLARELHGAPELVLAAHPTRGLDVRTIAFVQRELLNARDRGAAVLLLSADLNEVWAVADRVMVMAAGRLHGPVPVAETSRQEVGRWMTGHA